MDREPVSIEAEWDRDAKVWWVAKSSYPGLITEAPTLDELLVRAQEALAMLLDANHEAREHRRLRLVATAA